MSLNWEAGGMCMWKEQAVNMQQGYFHLFGKHTWREYIPSDYTNLRKNIGFTMFGLPENEGDVKLNNGTGYTDEQLKHINTIFDIIKKSKKKHNNQENIWVSFLFVMGKAGDDYMTFSVFRIPEHDVTVQQNNNIFIDSSGRVYKDWQDYLNNNQLPDCVICYPKSGIYSARNGVVEVEFGISPAGNAGSKILKALDIGVGVLNTSASVLEIAAVFGGVPLPVVKGVRVASMVAGFYSLGRSVETLVDRIQHQQSIGLDNAESRNCWLGLAACLMNLASAYAITAVHKTVQTGDSVTMATKFALKSLTVGSCIVSAVGVCSGVGNIIKKLVNKEEFTTLDIFQVTSLVLFFTNSLISAQQAFSLIDGIGKNSTTSFSHDTEPVTNLISEIVKQTNVGKTISPFVSEYLHKITFTSVCSRVGMELFDIAMNWKTGRISESNWTYKVGKLLHAYRESWNEEMSVVIDKICTALGKKHWSEISGAQHDHIRDVASTVIAGGRFLANCETTEMPSEHSQVSYDDEVINILAQFVDRQICRNPEYFPIYMTFICKFVKSQFQEEKLRYEEMYDRVKHRMSVEEFNAVYGISGNPNNYFINKVFRKFKDKEHGFTLLNLAYQSQNTSTQENHGQSSIDVDRVSFYPFYNKRGLASNELLSEEQYCEMAAELTGQQVDKDSIYISECGTAAVMQVGSADVMMIQGLLENGKISGIAALLHSA